MNILEYIKQFRETNGEYFFLNGGCYIFARILQVRYGGVIYSNGDHCILMKIDGGYDIKGFLSLRVCDLYNPIDEMSEARYRTYETFN